MLPEIGTSELLVIAIVALIVVGPKDLPMLLRKLGQFMAKLRGMAADFRASFDEMARQSELDELRKEVEAMRRGQLADIGQTEINQTVDEIQSGLNAPVPWRPAEDTPAVEAPPAPKPVRKRAPSAKAASAKATTAKAKSATSKSSVAGKAAPRKSARAKPGAVG